MSRFPKLVLESSFLDLKNSILFLDIGILFLGSILLD
jgi:hypothetical protein